MILEILTEDGETISTDSIPEARKVLIELADARRPAALWTEIQKRRFLVGTNLQECRRPK